MPMLGKLNNFAQGGKRMGEAYETAATKQLQQTGQAALRGIQSQMGGQGALGSTTHLGGLGDLASQYAGQRANISATAAGMGEQAMQNRLGLGIQGLGQLGNLASYEQMNQLQGAGQLAGLGLQASGQQMQADQMAQQQTMQGLGALGAYRQEPMNWGYQMWPGGGSPNAASGGGGLLPWIGALGQLGASAYGAGMFDFGGGGGKGPINWANK